MLDKELCKIKTKSKLKVVASQESIDEIGKFSDMFIRKKNAASAVGLSFVAFWMLCNGFTRIRPIIAKKMVELSGGKIDIEKLLSKK